ncbi:MAG: hypothetical protein WC756_15675 [Taibaiella sp.]|jgi:hypothetical protein
MGILRIAICSIFILSSCSLLHAQKNEYSLKGFMGVQGGESFTYKLELKDSVGNILSGYAYTYLNEKNDVKTYVIAEADRDKKTLFIREATIIHNHYFESRALICLVESLLTYNNTEHTLSGPLTTMTAGNGASCSKGSITFTNVTELNNLFNPELKSELPVAQAAQKPVPTKAPKIVYDTLRKSKPATVNTKPVPEIKKPETITEGKDKTYRWQSDNIVLEIWDGNNEDNDRVTILFNGTELLKDYVLTKQKKKLSIPVGGNELNIITIIANNEGGDPPNTANILLSDNDVQYDVIAHNTIGKRALIKIMKK